MKTALTSVYAALECDGDGSVVLTDDDEIRELNHAWRGLDEPTDVLSFALREAVDVHVDDGLLGDVVVSVETAARMAASGTHRDRVCEDLGRSVAWTLQAEIGFLIVHGMLHLLGYDHASPEEEAVMRGQERTVFELIGRRLGAVEVAADR